MIESILAILALIGGMFGLFYRTKAKRLEKYRDAAKIMRQDQKIDRDIEEKKVAVEDYGTPEDLERGFNELRDYGK